MQKITGADFEIKLLFNKCRRGCHLMYYFVREGSINLSGVFTEKR